MRIIFISASAWPAIGGVERHIRELIPEMVADGHQLVVIAPKTAIPTTKETEPAGYERIMLHTSEIRLVSRLIGTLSLGRHLPTLLKADIIHYHDYQPLWRWGLWLHPLLRLAGKNIFITFHGWEGQFPPSRIVRWRRQFISAIVDGSLAIGHYISKWYDTYSEVVCYGGVRLPSSEPRLGDYALFVGRLDHDTGILHYLDALSNVLKDIPTLRLIVCGDGALRSQAESLAARLGIEAQFLGALQNPDPYFRDAKMVFASGYLAMLEAFSYGKSVIATYENPLKRDYLCLMPNSEKMMWVCANASEISDAIKLINATPINERSMNAYCFAKQNSWYNVKQSYYKLWGLLP